MAPSKSKSQLLDLKSRQNYNHKRRLQNTIESRAITNPKTSCNVILCSIQESSVMAKQIEPTYKNYKESKEVKDHNGTRFPQLPQKSALDLVRLYSSSNHLFSNASISYSRICLKEIVWLTNEFT